MTAGGPEEPIDSVRFSGTLFGKMGLAVAREAVRLARMYRGGRQHREARTGREPPVQAWRTEGAVMDLAGVRTRSSWRRSLGLHAVLAGRGKIRRARDDQPRARPHGRRTWGRQGRYPDLFVVGFAATHGDPVADAREKLASKGTDLVVGNDISREGLGFGAADNEVYIVGREKERFVPRASKEEVARVILDSMMVEMDEER